MRTNQIGSTPFSPCLLHTVILLLNISFTVFRSIDLAMSTPNPTSNTIRALLSAIAVFHFIYTHATTWNVGPSRMYTYCSQIASLVQQGDTILIDFATYVNDPQVIWNKSNLYIAGINGRPRLEAGSIIANDMVNGKGIFVISGSNVHVHNIEFANAVVQDNNGAGIRQEGANLWVSSCAFSGNEMGILGGNIPNCKTTIEYCEFLNSGSTFNPGYQHNVYINHIDTLVFRFNYSHDAIAEGHELKSRASYNFILYNRIANEGSEDSRTIDLPNGGTSVIVGNIIEQGPASANSNLLGYGLEGLTNPAPHALYCCSNSFINKKTTGSFIQVANGTDSLFVKNNIFAGAKTGGLFIGTASVLDSSNNAINNALSVFGFEDETNYNYRLLSDAIVIDKGVSVSKAVHGYSLNPSLEYLDQHSFSIRPVNGVLDIGAFEYASPLHTTENSLNNISFYPNPASGFMQIDIDINAVRARRLSLLDLSGKEVLSQALQPGNNIVDISGRPSGLYFVVVTVDREILIRKLYIY